MAVLSTVPHYHTIRCNGVVLGQRASVLVDVGDTHNFIDVEMVDKIMIPSEPFYGFIVVIPGHNTMQCNTWVPKLQVTIGNYNFVDSFYVVDVADTNLVLGLQRLYSIGENSVNYQILEMKFQYSTGVLRVVRGKHTYPKKLVNCNSMRSILRHWDIEWAAECYITSPKPKIIFVKHPKEIETLLHKYEKVFRDLPHGRPLDRGVEHNIVLEEGTSPIHIPPYRHPKKFIYNIYKDIQ